MEDEIQETNYNKTLIEFYVELKELKEDWEEIVEDGIDIDNIMRTYQFFVKYIENDNFENLEFEDYVLFYIQDKSEFAVRHFFEKIWEEIKILLNIYDENRDVFKKYDYKGLSNSIVHVPFFFNYNDIQVNLDKCDPEELEKIWEKQIVEVKQWMELETQLIIYRNNLDKVKNEILSEIDKIDTLYDFIYKTRYVPFFFDLFTTSLMDYASIIGKYIDKVLVRKQANDSKCHTAGNQAPSYKIEGKLLDDLYTICNEVVFRSCSKEHFAFIINGGQPKENQENKINDIKHLNRFYYLVRNMELIIPYTQYGLWKYSILKSQNIKEEIFEKKWSSITTEHSTSENKSFKRKVDSFMNQHAYNKQGKYDETNSAEHEIAKDNSLL